MEIFEHEAFIPFSLGHVYDWMSCPSSVDRLLPPWLNIRLRRKLNSLSEGSKLSFSPRKGPFKNPWKFRVAKVVPNQLIEMVLTEGPFSEWTHELHFQPDRSSTDNSFLRDFVEYGKVKGLKKLFYSKPKIEHALYNQILFRNACICNELTQLEKYAHHPKKRILIAGSSGMVGQRLRNFLLSQGHSVYRLSRKKSRKTNTIYWDHSRKKLSTESIEGFDVVIHLGGANVSKKWTKAYKKKMVDSRVQSTKFLVSQLKTLKHPPELFICASGTGYYGSNLKYDCDEESSSGSDFLADLCFKWEKAAQEFNSIGRSIQARLGVVLSPQGGMLSKVGTAFSRGMGGMIGDGKQSLNWISIDDVLYQIQNIIYDKEIEGAVNLCAPEIVSNKEFTKTLGEILQKPTIINMPAPVVKLLFGEMGETLLLGSNRAVPNKLLERGHSFAFPVLKQCLRHLYGKYTEK